jgi:hypothetical protein
MLDGVHMPIRIYMRLLTPVCIPIVYIHREIRFSGGRSGDSCADVHLAIPFIILFILA